MHGQKNIKIVKGFALSDSPREPAYYGEIPRKDGLMLESAATPIKSGPIH
jgi:hypothetical protein